MQCRVSCHDAFWNHFLFFSRTVCRPNAKGLALCWSYVCQTSFHFPLSTPVWQFSFLCCVFWLETSTLSTVCHYHFGHVAICQWGYRCPVLEKCRIQVYGSFQIIHFEGEIWCSLGWKELQSSLQIWYCDHCFIGQVEKTLLAIAFSYFEKKKKRAINPTFWQSRMCIVQTNCSPMH